MAKKYAYRPRPTTNYPEIHGLDHVSFEVEGTMLVSGQHRLAAMLSREDITPERARELLGWAPQPEDQDGTAHQENPSQD